MSTLLGKFRGCLIGAVVGDVIGAVVEAESPSYIVRTYASIDAILAAGSVSEFQGPDWRVGACTDDTQMMVCVAEWLLAGESASPQHLLARFTKAYEPWRRYGPGMETIVSAFNAYPEQWRELSTMMFPWGSYGNGSATRVAPVGLLHFRDGRALATVAIESSRPTHSHSLAYQGAVLQATAVATAVQTSVAEFSLRAFLDPLRRSLSRFSDLMQDTSRFAGALDAIDEGLSRGRSCREMAEVLGTGICAHDSVPIAIYCALRHPGHFDRTIHEAVFAGGDTDTIASMAGAVAGALAGQQAIPQRWIEAVRDDRYSTSEIEAVADRLWAAR